MNGWPARSAASRKTHPKHIHPGRGAFCAPAVFAAGEMRLNGSKGREAFRSAKSRTNTNYILSIENKISFAHSAGGRGRTGTEYLSVTPLASKDAGKSKSRFFDKNLSHVILTVKKDSEKSVLIAVGGLRGLGAKRRKIEFVMEFEIQFFCVAERP